MAAPVTHFEIMAKDGQRARDFYSGLFGWKIDVMPEMGYGMVNTAVKMGINGGIGQVDSNGRPNVTIYVQVEDIQAALDKAAAMGGNIIVPVTDVPGVVTFAQFSDPDGNIVGLVKGPQTPPKKAKAKPKKAAARKKAVRPAPRKPAARKKTRR